MNYDLRGKQVLVTGGTGQIGSFLIEFLLKEKANVLVLGRDEKNVKDLDSLVKNKLFKFIKCDLIKQTDFDNIHKLISETQYLVHLASDLSPESDNLFLDAINSVNSNLLIMPHLLKRLQQLEGIFYSSSVAVYGIPDSLPLDEKSSTNPMTFYGCGKLGAEKYLQLHSTLKSIPLEILRFVSIYGPRNRSQQVIPTLIKKAITNESITLSGKGKNYRDFLHVFDAVSVILLAIKENQNNCYNIGSGTKCTILHLAETIIEATQSKSKISLLDTTPGFDSVTDISKAKENLNFNPQISLYEGLKTEVAWHKENQI